MSGWAGEKLHRHGCATDAGALALLILALLGFKAWLTQAAGFDLHYDEAQYWEWSQQLDWSYYSKGPLLAWLIALSETLFGHGEWQVRLFGWLAHGILLALIFFFAHDVWGNRRAAWWAVIITLFTPLYFTLGMVMSTDIFLFTCWTWGLWAIYRALFRNQPWAWYEAGAAIGIGALTKLSIGLLPFFAGLLIIFTPALRHHLKSPHVWGGVAILLAFMSPVLFWNATHNWVMFRHEMGHVQGSGSNQYLHLPNFIAGQLMALSPIVAALAISVLWRRPTSPDQRFLWWLALCWIGFFAFKALSAKVQINWPAPSYIGLLILFAGHIPAFSHLKRRLLYAGMVLATVLMGIAYFPHKFGLGDPFKDTKAWQQPIAALATHTPDNDFILTESYAMAGELAFYWPRRVPVYVTGNSGRRFNQHDLWPSIDREAGRNAIFVSSNPQPPPQLAQAFDECTALPPIAARAADGRVLRTFYGNTCKNYRPIVWPVPGSY